MEMNSKNLFKQNLIRVFLKRNTAPAYLQIIQTCVQAILYVTIINGYSINTNLFSPSTSELIIALILKGLLFLRKFKGMSLIRFVYIVFYGYILTTINSSGSIKTILLLILLTILIIIDVVSSISFGFSAQNLSSQQLNVCKVLHYVAILFGLTQSILFNSFAMDAVSAGIFIILWLVKKNSLCRSKIHKQLLLRIYVWMVTVHIMALVTNWISSPLLAQILIPIAISQIIMQIYLNIKIPNFDQLYSQQNYLQLAYQMINYVHGQQFDPQMQKQINNFVSNSSSLSGQEKNKAVYQKMISILTNSQSFQQTLILSQIYIFNNHQLLKSKYLLQKMKKRVSNWSWIQKICLYRVEQWIKYLYKQKNKQIHFQYYDDYYKCDQFRSLLLKSSISFISLWQYTKRPEILSQRYRQLSDRVVKLERKLKKEFTQIQTKCLSISMLYISYLLQVARDPYFASNIVQALAFNEDFEVNLYLDQKVFVQLSLQEELMHFQKVGYNISSLLGYQKKEMQGQRHDILLPQFYRKSHNNYIQSYLSKSMSGLYLYNKKSIARNKWGHYEQCDIVLRLHYDFEGRLILRGYLQISLNQHYYWNYYLFINSKQQIIECSQTLSDYAPSLGRLHKASQVFKDVKITTTTLIQKIPDNDAQYHPLLIFKTQDMDVTYYVRANNSQYLVQTQEKNTKCMQNIQMQKYQWGFIKKYYLKLQELSNAYQRQYLILFFLSILLIIGIVLCQIYLIKGAVDDSNFDKKTMRTTQNIIYYYNNSVALGMKVNYNDMKLSYGYSNIFSQANTIDLALALQTTNDQLKIFTKYQYSLPSTITGVIYSKPNYDMIVEFLSNAYMVRQFTDDPFMQAKSLSRARLSIPSIFGASITEYESHFMEQLISQAKSYVNQILLAILIFQLTGFCILIVRFQYKLRQDQHKTLNLLATVSIPDQLINSTKIFISKITRQEITLIKYQNYDIRKDNNLVYNSSFAPDSTSKDVTRSQMSLREVSGRDLLGETFNRSGVLQISQVRQQKEFFSYQNREVNVSPIKRWIVILPIVMSLIIVCCIIANQIFFNINRKIDKTTSVSNIFNFFSTGNFFSRAMILFLNLITTRQEVVTLNTIQFDNFIANYTKQKLLVVFTQSTFPQFSPFSKGLQQVQYQYMCKYISCDPLYAKDINIVYTSTIQKIIAQTSSWKPKFNAMNVSNLEALLKNGELNQLINLIYYTQSIIRLKIISLIDLYFDCFGKYSDMLTFKKKVLIGGGLGVTILILLLLIVFIYYIITQKELLFDIANLIKTDSYFNQDNRIADNQNKTKQMIA